MIGLSALAISAPLSYLAAFWIPALDAVVPILPSETVVIALGVATAGSADPRIAILVLLAAAGAFAGDNLAYFIGRRFGPAAERRFFAGERGAHRRAWATQTLDRYGGRLIILCRFIPGGRTAVTVTCGIVGYERKRFVVATACAAVIWACYAYFLGRLGGTAFERQAVGGLPACPRRRAPAQRRRRGGAQASRPASPPPGVGGSPHDRHGCCTESAPPAHGLRCPYRPVEVGP